MCLAELGVLICVSISGQQSLPNLLSWIEARCRNTWELYGYSATAPVGSTNIALKVKMMKKIQLRTAQSLRFLRLVLALSKSDVTQTAALDTVLAFLPPVLVLTIFFHVAGSQLCHDAALARPKQSVRSFVLFSIRLTR